MTQILFVCKIWSIKTLMFVIELVEKDVVVWFCSDFKLKI